MIRNRKLQIRRLEMIVIVPDLIRGVIKSKGGAIEENFLKQSLENNVFPRRKEGVK
jgi:hypothetical protein